MNQAWVGRGSPVPNSAVPVLPATWPGRPASAAVPWVTTWRIRARRVAATLASSGSGDLAGSAAPESLEPDPSDPPDVVGPPDAAEPPESPGPDPPGAAASPVTSVG